MLRYVVGGFAFAIAGYAMAGFSIEGAPSVSSERGPMGQYQPYEQEARASFRGSDADLKPRQARYQDAELLVDLAYKPVTQKGSGHADRVEGFADDVPFATAMSMILPSGWQLYKGKSLAQRDVPEMVSYLGGRTWPEVLGRLGERYALQFHVDWYDRTVVMAKGRPSPVQQAARIRVIAEPAPKQPATKPLAQASSSASGAAAFAAKPAPGIQTSADKAKSTSALPRPVLKGTQPASLASTTTVGAGKVAPNPVAKPIEVAKPALFSMQVRSGTLYENVIRLSKEQGWEAPAWSINGDYSIPANYSIQAANFAEAMVKLLMLHPIEADVNTAQRKIFVLKEVR